jgi:AcrR family transcriptional regulator
MPAKLTEIEAKSRRDEILAKAATAFAVKGYEKTTVRDLEQATGLTRGGIFFYFPSKRDVYRGVLNQCMGEGLPVVRDALLGARTVEEAGMAAFTAILDWHAAHPETLQLFHQMDTARNTDSEIATMRDEVHAGFVGFMVNVVREMQSAGIYSAHLDAEATAMVMHSVMDGLVEYAYAHPRHEADEFARRAFAVMADGMRPSTDG